MDPRRETAADEGSIESAQSTSAFSELLFLQPEAPQELQTTSSTMQSNGGDDDDDKKPSAILPEAQGHAARINPMGAQSYDIVCRKRPASEWRKRVQFDEEDGEQQRVMVQVFEFIRPASEMSSYEKECIWYPKSHFTLNMKSHQVIAKIHSLVQKHETSYAAALSTAYTGCCLDQTDDWSFPEHCAQHLAVVSTSETCVVEGESNRGLENITVEEVGMEILRRRKEAIASVIMAQQALVYCSDANGKAEILRRVSEDKTRSARKFAKALGTADAMLALLEYGVKLKLNPKAEAAFRQSEAFRRHEDSKPSADERMEDISH